MDRYPRRGRSAAAAAAPAAGQQKKQQQQQQKSKKQQEEEEDAALPADEDELPEEAGGSGSEEEDEGDDASEEEAGSDAAAGSGDAEEEAEEAEGSGEGEDDDDAEAAAASEEGEEADDEEEEGEEENEDDEQEGEAAEDGGQEEGATPVPSSSQQQQGGQQQQQRRPGAAAAGKAAIGRPKGKPGRPPGSAAKALQAQRVYKDYSYVLALPKAEQQEILTQADKVRKARGAARAAPFPEPKRNKCHWDHLLEEAEWMAKEFQRERGWKLKQAKRFVRAVKASKLDVESRAEVRAAEEVAKIRRHAGWISRQVAGFWKKAERVVNYKVFVAIEARKREVLDKHLDMIVGQTEAFSKMLAANLVGPEQQQQQQLALPAPAVKAEEQQQQQGEEPADAGSGGSTKRAGSCGGGRLTRNSSMQPEQQQQQQQKPDVKQEQQHVKQEDSPQQQQQQQQDEQQQDDDEPPEDETVAALAGELLPDAEPAAAADEAADAAAAAADGDAPQQQQDDASAVPAAAAGSKRRRSSGVAAAAAAADEEDADVGVAAAAAAPERRTTKRPRRAAAAPKQQQQPSKAGSSRRSSAAAAAAAAPAAAAAAAGDADFQSGDEASDDDEATLEEEERLAQGEGAAAAAADKELDELDEEANLPLEELLARYGFVVPDEDAELQHHDSSEEGEEEEAAEQQQQQDDNNTAAAAADGETKQGDDDDPQQQHDGKQAGKKAKQKRGKGAAGAEEEEEDGERRAAGSDDEEAMVAASRDAAAAQPTGFTLATTQVQTPVPFLLKHTLREYQHIGLDWLVSLYSKKLNGILADEMGLGKTIQTVALLAYLACEEGVWGPHLVVVPTSVMLNWEMEFKKWCPAFKLLTYYGSAKERKAKRQGWSKPGAFHVCITSYTLVLQDAKMFRRKKWKYLILDEAHMIKNWKSQRWQTLLRFNSKRRLLITGTPLQNDLMELWSLMHFLMPAVFSSHAQFKDWFSNPLSGAVEAGGEVSVQLVERLHGVLRPFLLRRLKSEVEKQMPAKHEHVLTCRLSKRQRQLYDEYMSRSETRAVMSGGNFMGVVGVLMQLRKVCNHPDLFEGRAIVGAAADGSAAAGSSSSRMPLCGWDLVRAVGGAAHPIAACLKGRMGARALADLPSLILELSPTYEERAAAMEEVLQWFMVAIPRARGRPVDAWCSRPDGAAVRRAAQAALIAEQEFFARGGSLRTALVRKQLFFPDRRLLQYDCGKLVELDLLLRQLKAGGHRVLIFTQMAKMLDVLEAFLNLHGHVYMRLDGSTKPEQRQVMMQRFNSDTKYFVFILSTRSGGVGINLTGADTVVFYDSDWNPAMDAQAQDRCHRIGQTREVHIYRLISANTIEENILRKSDQKRQLDWLAIQSGGFNTEMLAKLNLSGGAAGGLSADDLRAALRSAEDEDDAAAAAVAEKEAEAEMDEFTAEPPPEEAKDEDLEGGDGDEPSRMGGGTRAGTPASASTVPPPPPPSGGGRGRGRNHHASCQAAAAAAAAAKGSSRASSPPAAAAADGAGDGADGDKDKEAAAAAAAEPEEDAEEQARDAVIKDLATLQEGQSGKDLLARLSSSLSPIEQYAVRHLEAQRPVDVEAAAAAAVEDIQREEWELDAIERRKEQQEAEAEDSDEVIEGWDKAAADAAYQEYQQEIKQILADEEAEAAKAAAAAALEAEMLEADLAAAAAAGANAAYLHDYPAEYSGYGLDGELGEGLEVTSPGSGRPKRDGVGQQGWSARYANLPSHFQQQQGGWQPLKKQRGLMPGEAGGSAAAGAAGGGFVGGRGRGRGRVGRPPGYTG
ncbi:hypothetical protein OEZ85_006067 [Tetradesmus obliquus]|uniref:Uncharacterized protein n=1 Tax=Tetradesmus obliquus TaxID=3088 RepID=A0ABY8UIL6_TETOB|nr:hypothetical protein OEZ85_006067 [Tetradesmus obliquus]